MFHRQSHEEIKSAGAKQQDATGEKKVINENQSNETEKENKVMADNQSVYEEKESNINEMNVQNETSAPAVPGGVAFQKSGMSHSPRMPGAFPGASYGTAGNSPVRSGMNSNDDRRLIIGRGITMSGEIESCDTLVVEGTVEAALKGAKILDVSETGMFYGTVEIEEAVISGRFEGDIMVTGRLTITSTGSVTGSVAYGELAIEAGATIDGRISPLSVMGDQKTGTSGKGKVSAKGGVPNDNEGVELPFSSTVAAE